MKKKIFLTSIRSIRFLLISAFRLPLFESRLERPRIAASNHFRSTNRIRLKESKFLLSESKKFFIFVKFSKKFFSNFSKLKNFEWKTNFCITLLECNNKTQQPIPKCQRLQCWRLKHKRPYSSKNNGNNPLNSVKNSLQKTKFDQFICTVKVLQFITIVLYSTWIVLYWMSRWS